ncbi:AAA domain-containing protein [Streptomyces sp. NPDC006208]|uniref:DEAD/DEAH box helicase n=1 Tax=Streptomyces sp. NPDC006208 TaxID=3156734 RepID=UPI00339E84DA
MAFRTVDLPGPVILVPGTSLEGQMRQKAQDHPGLPTDPLRLAADLNSRDDGAPATFSEPRRAGGDRSLLVHGGTYLVRLFLTRPHHGSCTIAAIDPLRMRDHHRLSQGCLLLRPTEWRVCYDAREVPQGSDAYWPMLAEEWLRIGDRRAAERGAPALTAEQTQFLDTVDQLIDASETITTEAARSAEPFPYASVGSTGGQRHGTRAVYEFRLAGPRRPEEGAYVRIRGRSGYRGQVTRAAGASVTVRFDQPVDWAHIDQQGELEITPNSVVYGRQREAVALLRARQARSTGLLPALVDHRVRPIRPVSGAPTEELDDDQLQAFRKAVAVEDMLLVLGPPGTGKTRTISQIAAGTAAAGLPDPVLVTSHTNRAVDNVLSRLPRDLVVVRVGNEERTTAEGRPFLMERQAAELREEILRVTGPWKRAYAGVGVARQWARELGGRLDRLGVLAAEETRLRDELGAARRAVGGPAQTRVDELTSEHLRTQRALGRRRRRTERLTRSHQAARRRRGWWLIGFLFGLPALLYDRRLAAAHQKDEKLLAAATRIRDALAEAQRQLDAVTRDVPAVRAARKAADEAERRTAQCRSDACTAARSARESLPAGEAPSPVRETEPVTCDRDLAELHDRLELRLPLLTARGKLLGAWHEAVSGASEQLYPELIRYAHVIAATCIGTASRPELSGVDFELAIVDEAGQIGMADVLVPLVRARRAVLVGDHQQLPPFLDSEVEAWGKNVGDPAVVKLLAESALESLVHRLPKTHVVPLTRQRRMPSVIADFISSSFYDGKLSTPVERGHRDPLFRSPFAFVDTACLPAAERYEKEVGRRDERWGQRGCINQAEARLLTRLAAFYHRNHAEWAVIVPYKAQKTAIAAALSRIIDPEQVDLNVGTVDSFQGGERDVILYGFTRSNPDGRVGFLKELRRANVAFTRVKHQLVLVGDMDTLTGARDTYFRELARSLRGHLAEHGDIRQYREISDHLATLADEGDRA